MAKKKRKRKVEETRTLLGEDHRLVERWDEIKAVIDSYLGGKDFRAVAAESEDPFEWLSGFIKALWLRSMEIKETNFSHSLIIRAYKSLKKCLQSVDTLVELAEHFSVLSPGGVD